MIKNYNNNMVVIENHLESPLNLQNEDVLVRENNSELIIKKRLGMCMCCLCLVFLVIFSNYISFCLGVIYFQRDGSLANEYIMLKI
tara:strand:- start:306 stop:563 length:258 start_codon:yes stop_codon:yes gene_type:complete